MSDVRAKALFFQGIDLLEAGNHGEALKKFRASYQLAPLRPSTLDNMAACCIALGRFDDAEVFCQQSIKIAPNSPTSWYNRALIHRATGAVDAALACFKKVIDLDPSNAEAWYLCGVTLADNKSLPEAISCFENALSLNPNNVTVACAIGEAFAELKLPFTSLAVLEKAALIPSESGIAYASLGRCLHRLSFYDQAVACFKKALSKELDNRDEIEFEIASITRETMPGKAPESYVANLFDAYASTFDEHLQNNLQYRAPDHLFQIIRPIVTANSRILDLGCGTGLMAERLGRVAYLEGVDLSARMVEVAKKKGIYNRLLVSDINVYMASTTPKFDVIIAADVFEYLGDLSETFRNVAKRLLTGGTFAFTVECCDEAADFKLNITKRYSHSRGYLERLASEFGFSVGFIETAFLRNEGSAPEGKLNGIFVLLVREDTL